MLKKLLVFFIVIGSILVSCTSETSGPQHKAENNATSSKKGEPLAVEAQALSAPTGHQRDSLSAVPTRSELRVLSEQTKISEDKARDYIEQFDVNLSNTQMRKETQEQFKKLLPDYKEKMLQLGKAKLKQAAKK